MSRPGSRERLVGCWRLIGYSVAAAGVTSLIRWAITRSGPLCIRQTNGYLSARLAKPGPDGGNQQPTAYALASSGPYEVDELARTVAYQVHGSVIPSWLGTTPVRQVQFPEAGALVLSASVPSRRDGGLTTTPITWSRQLPRQASTSQSLSTH